MKIVDIIKYEGGSDTLVWKSEVEDFNTMSQLVVHEAQEAVFFRDGRALDVFGPGRYTLHTDNLPLLKKVVNIPADGKTPFHCEVYFINKAMPLDMKWGTNSQVVVQDPKFNILLHAGANGGMGVQIEDSRKFLAKFVGTTNSFNRETLTQYFRDMISTRVKTYLTNIGSQISFTTINSKLEEMSEAMFGILSKEVKEFGVKLVKFFVSAIQLDRNDYEKIQDALANASVVGISATAEKGRMDTLGYSWADQEIAEILKTYAANEGGKNQLGDAVAQIPLALAFGEMMKGVANPLVRSSYLGNSVAFGKRNSVSANGEKYCSSCGKAMSLDAKFCSGCGQALDTADSLGCANCGHAFKGDEKFCSECGTKRGS